MNLEKIFKNLIKIEFILLIFSFIIAFLEEETGYYETYEISAVESTLFIWLSILALIYIINLFFLYKFKPIGKALYLPLLIFMFILSTMMPIDESLVNASMYKFGSSTSWLGGIINGMIIALLYFTEIKDKFKKQ